MCQIGTWVRSLRQGEYGVDESGLQGGKRGWLGWRWVRFAEIGNAWCAMVRLGARVRLGWDLVLELARDEFSKPAIDNKDGDASKRAEFMDGMDTVGSACRRSSPRVAKHIRLGRSI